MARFYRTSNITPIDYMYRINAPLMEKVLETNDNYITQELGQANQLGQLTQFNHLAQDEEAAKKLSDAYMSKIDELSNTITKDPANWRKQLEPLRNLTRDLQTNYASGAISKYVGNYNQMKNDFAQADKQAELWHTSGGKKGANPDAVNLWKQHALASFKGTDDPTNPGKFNRFSTNPLSDNIDLNSVIDETMAKVVKDSSTKEFTAMKANGAYFDDESHSWKGIPKDKILSVVMNRISSDPNVMRGLSQYQDIGFIKGGVKYSQDVLDENGNVIHKAGEIISPFSSTKNDKLSEQEQKIINTEQNRINILKRTNPKEAEKAQEDLDAALSKVSERTDMQWNSDSYLAPFLQGALDKYSGTETVDKSKLRNNSLYNLGVSNQAAMSRLVYGQGKQDQRQQKGFENAREMEAIKHANDLEKLQMQLDAKANNGKKITKAGDKNVSSNNILGSVTSTPFAFMGTNPEEVSANLQNRIQDNNKSILSLYKSKKEALNSGNSDLANYIGGQIKSVTSEQMTLGQRDAKAKENAIKDVIPQKDIDKYYTNGNKIEQQYFAAKRDGTLPIHPELLDDYNKMLKYSKRVENAYKDNLLKATKETTNGATVVETTNSQDDFIRRSISAIPSAYKIIDPKTGAEEKNVTFENGSLDPESENLIIVGASPSGGQGGNSNMVIHAKVKGVDNVLRDVNIQPVGPTAQAIENKLLSEWSRSSNSGVKSLATTMSSPYYKAINEATTGIVTKDNNPNGLSSTVYKEIGLPSGQGRIGITRIGSVGYKLQLEGKNGWVNIPPTNEKGERVGDYFTTDADMVETLERLSRKIQEQTKK